MKKKEKVLVLVVIFFTTAIGLRAQPGCPNINAGPDQTLNCVTTCATLNASVLQTGESTSYSVSSIPYAPPYPYNGGTQIMANIDDTWSSAISLPFNFCFFGNVYNQIVVGSNGVITFDASVAGGYCSWSYSVTCPSTSLHKNAIFGPYHDIDPSVSGGLYYGIQGVAPCRTFVISYYDVAMFSSSCNSLKATHQIVLYENTNVIEVYILNKPTCSSWNSGNAVVGIQNSTGTVGYTAPNRNTSVWTATNEAWRFTPNGAPNYSVAWFEGATQIDTGLTISVCPSVTTTYTGKVTYTNCDASQVIVQDQVTVDRVNDLSLSVSPSTPSFCAGNNTNITASGATSYSWYPSTGLSGTSGDIVNASPTSTTTYNVIGTYGGCIDTVSTTISVTPGPVVVIANPDSAICGGSYATLTASGANTYSWSPSATLSSSSGSSVNATPVGTVTYTVTGTTSGCSGTASATVSINPNPTVSISSNSPICENSTLSLFSGGGTSYSWSGPDGFVSTAQNPSISGATMAKSGNYIVTVTGAGGCTSTAQTTVAVNAIPIPTAGNDGPLCSGSTLNFNSSGGTSYNWSGPNSFVNTNQNPSISAATTAATGSYTVTVTGAGGCTATAQTTVTVNESVVASASSNTAICAGNTLNLSSTPSSGTSYQWSGPNSFSSASQNPSISSVTVSAAGIYTVTVTLIGGCTGTAQTTVTINPLPTVTIGSNTPICAGSSLNLTSGGGTGYSWSGPDFTNLTQNPTITGTTVSSSGTYTVTVTGTGNCTSTAQTTVVVNPNPTPTISSNSPICENTPLNLTSGGGTGYSWSGPNSFSSATQNPSIAGATTSIAGTYTVTVTGTGNCTSTTQTTVVVNLKPIIQISPSVAQICMGNNAVFTASGANAYTWTPTANISPVSGSTVTVSPTTTTTYTAHGTTSGCADSAQVIVTVLSNPVVSVTPSTVSVCLGEQASLSASGATTYIWSPSNTLSLSTGSDVVATPIATTTYTVTGTTSGCTGTATATVSIKPLPQLSVTPITPTICIHNSQTLTATGADTYSWSPDSTLSANTGCSVIADPISNCTYQLTGTLNGCKDSIQIPFVVNPLPIITIQSNPPSGCQPFTTTLSATSLPVAQSYSWTVNNGFNSTDPSPTLSFLNSGQYNVSLVVTDVNGCVNNITEANFITVNPKPTVTFSFTPEVGYVSKPVTFTSSIVAPNSQYIWDFGDGQTATSQAEATEHYYGITGVFSITHIYVNEFGCSDTATLPLNVTINIVIPNIFTPNNDGHNDTFIIDGLQYVDGAVMKIYNRWGRKIYHSDNYKNDWDGGDFADGVYFYILTLPDNLKVGPFNGSVTLLR